MEKNFTLMKTLTAFLDLLFPRRKNFRAVNNDQTFTTGGCGTGTTVRDHLKYMNDARQADASFLFFEQAVIDGQPSTVDSPRAIEDDKKFKSKDDPDSYREKKVNDELAQRNLPKPVNNWRQRVNDDLAACTAVDDPLVPSLKNSYKRKNDNINVDHIFTINDTTKVNKETRTNKNDAWLPFASFCFLFVDALAKADLFQSIGQLFFNVAEVFKNQKPVLLTIPIRSKETRKPNYNDGIKL